MSEQMLPELAHWVREASVRDASDIYLIPGEPPAMRVGGMIERVDAEPLTAQAVAAIARAAVGEGVLATIGVDVGQVRRSFASPDGGNVNVCVARSRGDYTVTAIVSGPVIVNVEQVGLPACVVEALCSGSGLVVFAGLAGSGKTTTGYSAVDYVNANSCCHICTVEDPVWVQIPPKRALVQQREVGIDVPNALARIHAAMGQDLDVLFIGEISGLEELQACITTAETGHLVITVMHAATPEDAVQRMIDVFPEELRRAACKALAGSLGVVCAQILMPAVRGGRVAAYGVIVPDAEMREAIAAGGDFLARRTPWPLGCRTLAEDVERLRAEGIVSDDAARDALARIPG